MSAQPRPWIVGFDLKLYDDPTPESLLNLLALMLIAPDDERMLSVFDLAWKLADQLDECGDLDLVELADDWQKIKAEAIRRADVWRRESA